MNIFNKARASRTMVWKKPGQGLDFRFTPKGSHERTGGSAAHFMAAIACEKGAIAAEQYFGRINADTFSSLFMNTLQACLRYALTQKENCFCKTGIHHKIVVKPDLLGTK